MSARGKLGAFALILGSMILACSASVDLGLPGQVPRDTVATRVAQTLQVFTQQALLAAPTATPMPTATPTPMRISAPPQLSVSSATDCYAGPSDKYGFVITIRPGTLVTVVGKDTPDNYWIIDVPGYPGTVCWLSGQHAQLTGDTEHLASPATPQPSLYTLSEPRNLHVSCSAEDLDDDDDDDDLDEWTVVLRWKNTEPDQTGVRIYRNGGHVATLGSHAGSYTETCVPRHHRRGITYGVQAFNGRLVSSIVSVNLRRCE